MTIASADGATRRTFTTRPLPSYDAKALRAKIGDPYPGGANGSFVRMPAYGGRLSEAEFDALVAFLLDNARLTTRRVLTRALR